MQWGESMIPVIATNVLTAAALGGVIWSRMGSIERATDRLREKIEEQNGRVQRIETWKARREGFKAGQEEDGG